MTHMRQMDESEGTFDLPHLSSTSCPRCGGKVEIRLWKSSCGSYEDEKHVCRDCGYTRWIDGIDS